MNARCRMLAHFISGFKPAGSVMRCPTGRGLYAFHYHAATDAFSPLCGRVPCKHRHYDINAAARCYARQHKGR